MGAPISLHGRVETYNGELAIRIPLDMGGNELAPLATRIGTVDADGYLTVIIKPWLAAKLRIGDGSFVLVDNENGQFTITRSAANDGPTDGAA